MNKRKFTWDKWDYDCDGTAYIIAVDECPEKENVPAYIVKEDGLSENVLDPSYGERLSADSVEEGWCKYQIRSDWDGGYGESYGGYVVEKHPHMTTAFKGKRGWFRVWIVRLGEWY